MAKAYIIASVRTAVGRAFKGSLKDTRPDDLLTAAIRGALDRVPNLDPSRVDDVIAGCAMPEGEQGMNVARICSLKAGLPDSVPAMTVNRFCSSGLQSIAMAASLILAGSADVVVAGGTESMTMVPMGGNKPSFNPELVDTRPEVFLPMGLTAEEVARRYKVTREDQDQFAYHSHRKGPPAVRGGGGRGGGGPGGAGEGGKFMEDEGGCGRRDRRIGEGAERTRRGTDGEIPRLRRRRRRPRGDGDRPDRGDPEAPEAAPDEAHPRGPGRAERGVRRAGAPRDPRAVAGSRQGERERRSDRPRASAGVHRRQAHRIAPARDEAAQRVPRPCLDVHRRRDGRRGSLRARIGL